MTPNQRAWYRGVAAAFISTSATSLSGLLGAAVAKPELLKGGLSDLFYVLGCAGLGSGLTGLFLYLQKSPLPPSNEDVEQMKQAIVDSMPRPRVLVVDDCQDFQGLLAAHVSDCDFIRAETARAGRDQCKTIQFDSIVIDRVLPDSDGLSIIQEIRELQPKAKLIVITGYPIEPEMIESAKAGGVVAFLSKDAKNFFGELKKFLTSANALLTSQLTVSMAQT